MAAHYRKRPVVIQAVQWTGDNDYELNDFVPGSILMWSSDGQPCITTLEGVMRANPGDWIIRGLAGEFYPCDAAIFAKSYEPVEAKQ